MKNLSIDMKNTRAKLKRTVINLEKLQTDYSNFKNNVDEIKKFNDQIENVLLNSGTGTEIEIYLDNLKELSKHLSDKHLSLMKLSQNVFEFSNEIQSVHKNEIKNQLDILKNQLIHNSEQVKQRINDLSDKLVHEKEFREKLRSFQIWIENNFEILEHNFKTVDLNVVNNKEFESLMRLLEEFQTKKLIFNELYNEIKEQSFTSDKIKETFMNDLYSNIANNYQNFEKLSNEKLILFKLWQEFRYDYSNFINKIDYYDHCLKNSNKKNDLNHLLTEIKQLKNSIFEKKIKKTDKLDELIINNCSLKVTDLVQGLENRIDDLINNIETKYEKIRKLDEQFNQLEIIKENFHKKIFELSEKVNEMFSLPTITNIEQLKEHVNNLKNLSTHLNSEIDNEKGLFNNIMKSIETTDNSTIQNSFINFDDKLNTINQLTNFHLNNFNEIIHLIEPIDNQEYQLNNLLNNIENQTDNLMKSSNFAELETNYQLCNGLITQFHTNKVNFEIFFNQNQKLITKLDRYPNFEFDFKNRLHTMCNLKNNLANKLKKLQQHLEAEKVIWSHINGIDSKLTDWLHGKHILSVITFKNVRVQTWPRTSKFGFRGF